MDQGLDRARRVVAVLLVAACAACATTDQRAAKAPDRGHPLLRTSLRVPGETTITTRVPAAQARFEGGLRSYYEGNRQGAARLFRAAADLDPRCAMCFWGVALATVPLNSEPDASAEAEVAATAIAQAQSLAAGVSAQERAHIEALALRTTSAGGATTAARKQAYARAMQGVAHRFPEDTDAQTLFGMAVLATGVRPASPGVSAGPDVTQDALGAVRQVLQNHPDHPGASRLVTRLSNRELGERWSRALMTGQEQEAMAAVGEIEALVSPKAMRDNPDLEGAGAVRMFTLVRFGRWQEILLVPPPRNDLTYVLGMWYYARGMALTRLGRFIEVPEEQAELREARDRTPPDRTVFGAYPARTVLDIAYHVLEGEIEHMRAHREGALRNLREAVRLEDTLPDVYPSPWYLPTRQVLGAALLWNDRPAEAEQVFREDLAQNPDNGWSLLGLSQSLKAQRRNQDAELVKARFQQVWAPADVEPPTSVF